MKKTLLLFVFLAGAIASYAQVVVTSCGDQYCISDSLTTEEVLEYYDIVESGC